MDWQPIETAPKDGTPILASDGAAVTTARWQDDADGYWHLEVCGTYAEDGEFYGATHWMPLPNPPEGSGRS